MCSSLLETQAARLNARLKTSDDRTQSLLVVMGTVVWLGFMYYSRRTVIVPSFISDALVHKLDTRSASPFFGKRVPSPLRISSRQPARWKIKGEARAPDPLRVPPKPPNKTQPG